MDLTAPNFEDPVSFSKITFFSASNYASTVAKLRAEKNSGIGNILNSLENYALGFEQLEAQDFSAQIATAINDLQGEYTTEAEAQLSHSKQFTSNIETLSFWVVLLSVFMSILFILWLIPLCGISFLHPWFVKRV